MTFILFSGIAAYMSILLSQMFQMQTFTVISDMQKKNVAIDQNRKIFLTKENFDIAVGFFYTGNVRGLQDRIDEYFSFNLNTIDYEIITDLET